MRITFKNATVLNAQAFGRESSLSNKDFAVENFAARDLGVQDAVACDFHVHGDSGAGDLFYNDPVFIFPAFCDVHVHFREPGFFYKETIKSGSLAAAHGGYSDVCTMPNLDPVPDSLENLKVQTDIIKKDAAIGVHPFGALTVGEKGERLSNMEELSPFVVGFSDDGRGVQSAALMEEAMKKAKALNKVIAAHCEDNSLLFGGYIHKGDYAARFGHRGISSESEWRPLKRDLKLAGKIGCRYHVCHVSTKESVQLIREAKKAGVQVTAETAPHYLLLSDENLQEDGRFKMNPPLRSIADKEALLEGLSDGTIDCIDTDHAPHSIAEKSGGLKNSFMGVVGLETAFSVLYSGLVKTGILSLDDLIKKMSVNPRIIFDLPATRGICVFDLEKSYKIDPNSFLSKGRATPFEGNTVYGKNLLTTYKGSAVWQSINR